MRVSRRHLIVTSAKASAAAMLGPAAAFATQPAIVLRRSADAPIPLPQDFIGLGYEMSSVARLGLLSPSNQPYLRLVRQLGPSGVLRVGGIVADFTRYAPDGTPIAEPKNTVITQAALQQFAAFLRATGWTAIWSVNFGSGILPDAVGEAKAVAAALGDRLQALELGNEVENYGKGSRPLRSPDYDYDQFRGEYQAWHDAIQRAVPNVHFAGPDTASSTDWVEQMAREKSGDVQLLTTHYYRNGQKQGSAAQLSAPDPALVEKLIRLRRAAQQSRLPWRMCETNSFSGGGLPGVSNTLLGALWTLDFMLLLARYGCSGINLETGVNQLGFVSSYSPIQDDGNGINSAGTPYYGMLAFSRGREGCTHSIALDIAAGAEGLTVYGLGTVSALRSVVLVNRGAIDLPISLAAIGVSGSGVEIERLTGPSLESQEGVTLAGAAVGGDGTWRGVSHEVLQGALLRLPAGSAAVLRRR